MEISLGALGLLLCAGALTSYMVGLVGAGSGALYIPFLLIVLPIIAPEYNSTLLATVIATATMSILVNAFASTYVSMQRHQIRFEMIFSKWIFLVIGGFAGAYAIYMLQGYSTVLKVLLGLLLLSDSVRVWRHTEPSDDILPLSSKTQSSIWYVFLSFIASAFGTGSQTYIMFLLKRLHYSAREAIGTSRAMSVLSTTASLLTFVALSLFGTNSGGHYFYWPAVICFSVTAVPFIFLGFQQSYSMPVSFLKRMYAIFVAVTGVWLIGYSAFSVLGR